MRPRRNGSSGRTGPSYSTEPGASTASSSLARRNRSVETCRALAAAMLAIGAAPARALLRPAPRHLVPGTATINGMGYICDLDGKRFTDRDVFVAHLRTAHHTAPARIPELLLMDDGRIHFLGEQTAAPGQLTDITPVFPLLADLEALSRESALDG